MDAEINQALANQHFDIEMQLLLDAIYLKYHCDFRGYAGASLKRRLATAMIRFGCETLSQLQDKVLHDATVFPALMDYLTVQVSEMFRDPSYFLSLREKVIPLLRTYPSLKIWVAGCSSGEEVYSLAILLREEGLLDRSIIYATDINQAALKKAEAGVYELDRIQVSPATTRNPGPRPRFRITIRPRTVPSSSTSRCARTWSSPITAWPPTVSLPRCTWCPAATC